MAVLKSALLAIIFSGCSSVGYLAEQGVEQWRLFNRARPADEVLLSPLTPPRVKEAIRSVREAKRFAVEELGLRATSSYETWVDLGREFVVWTVAGSDSLLLEERTWRFPIVGRVPYLGFFRREKAETEATRLREEEGLDSFVRGVPAFSSLGWFPDPIYSSFLRGSERDLVELVIHESLHSTVWVGDSVDFNEKLAHFVGKEGSIRFVASRRGGGEPLKRARTEVETQEKFARFVQEMGARYRREVEPLARAGRRAEALERKRSFYESLPAEWERRGGGALKSDFGRWNNAALLAYEKYFSDAGVLEGLLKKCGGDLARFVRLIVREREKGGVFGEAPERRLAELGECG
ncbi:MAG: aminopeptidase [Bdellovibrionales bacterium]|nr:aminopeptidase [Bdellovibrionales bacterium]